MKLFLTTSDVRNTHVRFAANWSKNQNQSHTEEKLFADYQESK